MTGVAPEPSPAAVRAKVAARRASFAFECRVERPDFTLEARGQGEGAMGLFGPSGAGKSTVLKALAGLIPGAHVRLEIDGEVLVDTGAGIDPAVHRRRVGLVFQEHRLFPHRSVEANLRYGAARSLARSRFQEVALLLGLAPLLRRRPGQCSGGEQARVALGRALLAAPRLLLLDEPFAALDRGLRLELLPYLERIAVESSVPILLVSHDLGDLLAVTDSLLLLERGRVLGAGSLPDLVREPERLDFLHDCGLVLQIPGVLESRDHAGLIQIRHGGEAERTIACGSGQPLEPGTPVMISLRPEDVILARPPCTAELSLTNQLPGVITHLTHGRARTLVSIDCGIGATVLAEVTARSCERLGLEVGLPILAMMKAQALRVRATESVRLRATSGRDPLDSSVDPAR